MKYKKRILKPIQHCLEYLAVRIVLALFSPLLLPLLARIGNIPGSITFQVLRIRREVTIERKTRDHPVFYCHRAY